MRGGRRRQEGIGACRTCAPASGLGSSRDDRAGSSRMSPRKLPPAVAETTFIHRAFGGRLRSQVVCSVCLRASTTYDPFLDLSLEITRATSLKKALERFTEKEKLAGANKYKCEHCRTRVEATKQLTVDVPPNVLTLQLKRFAFGAGGGKLDKRVDFDTRLDLRSYLSAPAAGHTYALYAVLVHSGRSLHSGHYFCFVRAPAGTWYRMDDSSVSSVSEATVLLQRAYVLFYVRDTARSQVRPAFAPATFFALAQPFSAGNCCRCGGNIAGEFMSTMPFSVNVAEAGEEDGGTLDKSQIL